MPRSSSVFGVIDIIEAGWGATRQMHAGNSKDSRIWVSDGTNILKSIDPRNWTIVQQLQVFLQSGEPLNGINGLESIMTSAHSQNVGIKHYIFATVSHSNNIFMIDMRNGEVVKDWDLTDLHDHQLKHVKIKKEKLEK